MDIFNPFTLKGKTALMTGISSGIDRGIAIACSKMGASVVINGRSEQRLVEVLREIREGENLSLIADLSQTDVVAIMVKQLPKSDGVVHYAGIEQRILYKQLQGGDLDNMMDVSFKVPVMFQTELLGQKKINKGTSTVFIASIAYNSPIIDNAMYCASKSAVISYANYLALELAPGLIRVNCILPAMIWTDLVYKGGITEEELKEDKKRYPLRYHGKPEDVADPSVYLLSDASAWTTGSSIRLTGGMSE